MSDWMIRAEAPGDIPAIHALTAAAFAGAEHSDGSEPEIIDRLREDGNLTLSLIAAEGSTILGHVAFSPVTISDGSGSWYGLGPVAVSPNRQREGIGAALIRDGLDRLSQHGANGIVLLGDPAYYARFGFRHDPALTYPGPPPEYFQRLVLADDAPTGIVTYARAFG